METIKITDKEYQDLLKAREFAGKVKASQRKWEDKNKKRRQEYMRQWQQAHKEHLAEYRRKRKDLDKEKK